MHTRRTWVNLVLGSALAMTLAACGSASSPGASSSQHGAASNNLLAGKSAAQVLSLAMAAADAKGSVHLDTTNTGSGGSGGNTFDVNKDAGKQTISEGSNGNASEVVVSGVGYMKGDTTFLQNAFGFPATLASTYAEQWISFKSTDPGYQQVVDGDTLGSVLSDSTPSGTLTLMGTSVVDGKRVVGVSGGLPPNVSGNGATGSVVLYVSTTSPFLPVELVEQGSLNGHSGTTTVVFSNWREDVSVVAPVNATPISSLASSSA